MTSMLRQISFVEEEEVPGAVWKNALEITTPVDPKDIPYVALSIHLGAKLWTGDKPLMKQMRLHGYECVQTAELESFIEKL